MKKVNLFKTLSVLLSSSLLLSCEFFSTPVKEFLQYYTETTDVAKTELIGTYQITDDDIICLDSSENKELQLYLRNPQNYSDLILEYHFDDPNVKEIANTFPDAVKITKLNSNSHYSLLFSKEFLETIDGSTHNSLKGTLKISQASTLRQFEEYKIDYTANTEPITVRNAMLQLENEGSGNYVLCFFVPKMSASIHRDIDRIIINGETFYMKPTRDIFYTDKNLTQPTDKFSITHSTTYPITLGGNDFESLQDMEGYQRIYFTTNQPMSEDTVTYDITLKDQTGLYSTISISNTAEKLSDVIIKDSSGTELTDNRDLDGTPKIETATIKFEHNGKTTTDTTVSGNINVTYSIINGDTFNVVQTGTKPLPCTVQVPYGRNYIIQASAQKSYYIDSNQDPIEGINVKHSPQYYVFQNANHYNIGSLTKPYPTVQNCIDTIKSEITKYGPYENGYTINLLSDIERTDEVNADEPLVNIDYYNDLTLTIRGTDTDGNACNRTLDAKGTSEDAHQVIRYKTNNTNGYTFNFNLENLTITGGYTNSNSGAGIQLFQEQGNTIKANFKNVKVINNILDKETAWGAGIYFNTGYTNNSFLTLENCTITENKSLSSRGGGIYIGPGDSNYLGTLTLKGSTTISFNSAASGAGIYARCNLNIESSSVQIIQNTADSYAGGIETTDIGSIKISGATIMDNTNSSGAPSNLYLASGKKITVTGPLATSKIYISTQESTANGNQIIITDGYSDHNGNIDPCNYFIGDTDGVAYSTDHSEAVLTENVAAMDPLLEEGVSFDFNNETSSLTHGTTNVISLKAIFDETSTNITSNITNWELTLKEGGYPVSSEGYSTSGNSITLKPQLPAGYYRIQIFAKYNGRRYGGYLDIEVQ